ncbi:MAG: hypothetical protein J0L63_01730 [Anaerolineae bacterium]|nr:hypothetical protein [Anaerolineae bacterium]
MESRRKIIYSIHTTLHIPAGVLPRFTVAAVTNRRRSLRAAPSAPPQPAALPSLNSLNRSNAR